jgi:indole-3-acetate monooxygenase
MTVRSISPVDNSGEDIVQIAEMFGDEIRARADEFEQQGHVSQDLAERLAELGLLRLCNPPAYSGPGRTPVEYGALVEALARHDGSTGWIAFIGITSALAACRLQPDVVQHMLASPTAITAGVFAPMGRAVPCEQNGVEGFRLNGQWAWGSGSPNASFISGGGFIVNDAGEIVKKADGAPELRSFFMPIEDVQRLDTWHVAGLKATGSADFKAVDVFVPRSMTTDPFAPTTADDPIQRFPLFASLGIGIGAVALGLAAAAMEEFLALAATKTPQGSSPRPLALKSATQRRVAQASATLKSARLFFYDAIETAWDHALQGNDPSLELRTDIRLANTHAVNSAVKVIDSLYTLAGGSSVYLKSPLQRHFRDIHVVTQHMMVNEATLELIGKIQLGVEANTAQL